MLLGFLFVFSFFFFQMITAGLKGFFKGLRENKNLKSLNLSFNGFSGTPIAELVNMGLSKNKFLEILNLENNRYIRCEYP